MCAAVLTSKRSQLFFRDFPRDILYPKITEAEKHESRHLHGTEPGSGLRAEVTMITIQGLYNTAVCYTNELEETARGQIQAV